MQIRSRRISLAAEKRNWRLKHAAPELRASRAFVLRCVDLDPDAFAFAADELREDRDFALRVAADAPAVRIPGILREVMLHLSELEYI